MAHSTVEEIVARIPAVLEWADIENSMLDLVRKNNSRGVIRLLKKILYPDPFNQAIRLDEKQKQFAFLIKKHIINRLDEKNQKKYFIKRNINANTISCDRHLLPSPHSIVSYAKHLKFLLEKTSDIIINQKQKKFLSSLSKKIPNIYLTDMTILESRLDDTDTVDLSIAIPRNQLLQTPTGKNKKSWENVKMLADNCNASNQNQLTHFPEFLEFDVNGTENDIQPNVFLTLNPILSKPQNFTHFIDVIKNKIDFKMTTKALAIIEKCLRFLPEENSLTHIGYMLARNNVAYKVVIFNFSIANIISYLRAIDWAVDYELLQKCLDLIPAADYSIALSLDIEHESPGKLGLELSLTRTNKNGFKPLLTTLVKIGACTHEKMQALLDLEFLYWGENLEFYTAHIIHIKINLHADKLSAKAYFSYLISAAFQRKI